MECFVIFVMAWCWFNATESKPRNVSSNLKQKMQLEENPNEVLIAEIKTKLKGKSYREISEILSTLQYELANEITY